MTVSKMRKTKALIRSAPLMFANPEDRFSHIEAHMLSFIFPTQRDILQHLSSAEGVTGASRVNNDNNKKND